MKRALKSGLVALVFVTFGSASVFAQRGGGRFSFNQMLLPATYGGGSWYSPWSNGYYTPTFGYGAYAVPFYLPQPVGSPYPYMPNYWWASPYSIADPRQEAYNPSGGYPQGSVAVLLLSTSPAKARITLDGVFVGNADALGPIQMPVGEHSLLVEATGFEPSQTVLKIEQPALQQMDVRLNAVQSKPKPGPKS